MQVPTISRPAGLAIAILAFANLATAAVQDKYSTWMASSIMSRSQGIMTGQQARQAQLGGEVLAYVW